MVSCGMKLGAHHSMQSSEQSGEIIVDIPSVSNEQHDDSIPRSVNLVHRSGASRNSSKWSLSFFLVVVSVFSRKRPALVK